MAGQYGSPSVVITYDSTAGGSPQTITAYVDTISGVKVEAITDMTLVFGGTIEIHTPTGVKKIEDITLEGWYNTTATSGPHVVLGDPDDGPQDGTRTFTFAPGDSKTFTSETRLVSYEVIAQNGKLSRYRAVIRQAGTAAWS